MHPNAKWPAATVVAVIERHAAGAKKKELAAEFGVPLATVVNWIQGYNRPEAEEEVRSGKAQRYFRNYTQQQYDQVLKMRKQGEARKVISELVGVSLFTIDVWLREAGIKKIDPSLAKIALDMRRENSTYADIADTLGVNKETVGYWCRQAGLGGFRAKGKGISGKFNQRYR